MNRSLALVFSAAIALSGMAWSAQAMSIVPQPGAPSQIEKVGFWCGPGYHLGPGGKYCWPNAYKGVPPHWRKACPPGYHLGPKGRECWRN